MNQSIEIDQISGDKMTDKKVMNRWLVVVGALLIQLCLGAIYAWSVFTPPLVAPLPDEDFTDTALIDGFEIAIMDDLELDEKNEISFTITTGDAKADATNISVTMELRDHKNGLRKDDDGDEVIKGPYNATGSNGEYTFTIPKDDMALAGNWHFLIEGKVQVTGNATVDLDYDVLQEVGTGDFGFTKTQTQIIFSVGLFFFAVFTVVAGRLSKKFSPMNLAMAGGIVLGIGYIGGSLVGTSFAGLVATIGVLGGIGIGLAYVVPVAVGVRWFPDKKGLITGLAVAGFGFGALIWVKLCTGFVFGPVSLSGDWAGLYGVFSVSQVFMVYGIAFAALVIIGGLVMKHPPEGWKPDGWEEIKIEEKDKGSRGDVEFTPEEMKKTPQYYMLFSMFLFGAMAGLMVIGIIKLFGIDALKDSGYTATEASVIAGTAMALFFSLANGIGRIAWGIISDKIGRKHSFVIMFTIQGITFLSFYFLGRNEYLLYLGATLAGFNFGGNFALFPAATADFFGNKSVGQNYGWVLLSYGIGGIAGPILGGIMGDNEAWLIAFIVAGVALLIAAGIGLMLKTPERKAVESSKEQEAAE